MTGQRRVKRILRFMGHGASRPLLVECFDESRFVLKYKNNPQGVRVLVNEYVATQTGAELDVPCPPCDILDLPEQLIAVVDLRVPGTDEPIEGGLSFGSMYLEGAFDNPPAHLMETVENLSQAPGVVVLDTWTLNGNRAGNATNIIVYGTLDDSTDYRFAIIDQGHCFTGPRWTVQSLEQTVNSMTLQGNNPILAPGITGRDCFEKFLLQLDSLQKSDMRSIVDKIPDEWAISPRERIALLEFMDVRRTKVREIIDGHFH